VSLPSWLPSWVLLVVIWIAGAIAVAANSLYPLAKDREAKERLGREARALLLPEIQQNATIASNMQKGMTQGISPAGMLQVAAWQTVSSGGLLTGLSPEETTKLLKFYSIAFEVNAAITRLTDLYVGVASALQNAPQLREFYAKVLQDRFAELQKAVAEVEGERPAR
jgi:hypothetical protein